MATATKTSTKRVEYVNTTQGYVGAVKLNRRNEEAAVAIEPGGRVFLTAEERELTEQSHKRAEDSPFVPREIIYFDPSTAEELGRAVLAPLEEAVKFARSGGKVLPV